MDEKEAQVKDEFTEKMEAAALESAAAPAEDPSSEAGQPETQPNIEQPLNHSIFSASSGSVPPQ